MHVSLHELTTEARGASSPAMARGILAEAQELFRNALDHGETAVDLGIWYSRTLQEWADSPAVTELVDGARLVFTGPVARLDALPTDPLSWIIIGASPEGNKRLRQFVEGMDLTVVDLEDPGTDREWEARAEAAAREGDHRKVAMFVDTGFLRDPALAELLIEPSVRHLPPTLRLADGLPDYSTPVDVQGTLIDPVVEVARWAGLLAGTTDGDTHHRLTQAQAQGVLTEDEAQALNQTWDTGLALELRRWRFNAWDADTSMRSLPSLDRSAYGAAARLVSVALRSIAGRHDIPVS
ncbi:putative nucleotidyltransferase substrate binding domain-containing protein [Corynebacterium sp.]|uniref:putative nucleotidyltransferase substrate binding domain-containing protein n=1 Tax=Corynebacterium sp. TaxID=1720 RepID=UPI0026DEDD7F|nr:putative nucleotidyltransferase substrate binding domain-containing protein [Corynebacterium sp.]MDO5513078.1 putative nucleotidyltransferase substrate binding domain-containing protein [Corynebacterium sp.]